ncbi:MAG: hypothetical protein LBK07_07855, partial [Tannerella sp.]|nr:hypothetical protein [Tannerella sp.]
MRKITVLSALLCGGLFICGETARGQSYSMGPYGPAWGAGEHYARGWQDESLFYNANTNMILLNDDVSLAGSHSINRCNYPNTPPDIPARIPGYGETVIVNIHPRASTWANPNYYSAFSYGTLRVRGTETAYDYHCSGPPSYTENVTSTTQNYYRLLRGRIVVHAGADVRLANNITHPGIQGGTTAMVTGNYPSTPTIVSSTLALPGATDAYSLRFDAAYTGTGGNYGSGSQMVSITPAGWTAFANGQGIGFRSGIASGQTFSVTGGGTDGGAAIPSPAGAYRGTRLMLGDATAGQGNITVATASGPVYVFNYAAGHHLAYGYGGVQPNLTVGDGNLYVRNDNDCFDLTFIPLFRPAIAGNGSIHINDNGDDPTALTNPQQMTTTRGHTLFADSANFQFDVRQGSLMIEGGDVTVNGRYSYRSLYGSKDHIAAKGGCRDGDITFRNGGATVTKDHNAGALWIARRDIHTHGPVENAPVSVHIMSGAGRVDWRAGRDVALGAGAEFRLNGDGDVAWYAMRDVSTNDSCNAIDRGAVRFDVTGGSSVLWNAVRHIRTRGRADFAYATGAGGSLTLRSDTGNITAERPLTVETAGSGPIRLLAESPAGISDGSLGNIFTYDSVRITRHNGGSGDSTVIRAQNSVRTAMVEIRNTAASGNAYLLESHRGDVWLGHNDTTSNPSGWNGVSWQCLNPQANEISYDKNRFTFEAPSGSTGSLRIRAGFGDMNAAAIPSGGGNIYFTHLDMQLAGGSSHATEIRIPFSNRYYCGHATYGSRSDYEQAGIVGGVARCASVTPAPGSGNTLCSDTGLVFRGYDGDLLLDAGTRGNIIINNGSYLDFRGGKGNTRFLTRWGDIDMRSPFNATAMRGDLLFLAAGSPTAGTGICGCEEKRNNVYLQDFKYEGHGSVFIGADNNIKLQYGGLRDIDTQRDPFAGGNVGYDGHSCGAGFHCDADTSVNRARRLTLNFDRDASGASIPSGGFAAVASDLVDVYRDMIYHGGQGAGMGAVQGYGALHGENVSGYGLYIKTQANKNNWNASDYIRSAYSSKGAACTDSDCTVSFLHSTARTTFHADARIYTQGQRSLVASPVIEAYGHLDLNTHLDAGQRTSIQIRTDSLIVHDSLIIDGPKTAFASWSALRRNMPVFKFGHHRFTPPFAEAGCRDCHTHALDPDGAGINALDTTFVTFRNDASVPRLHTMVADHTLLTFLTDSADHISGNPIIHAKFYVDTFKIRNHVQLIEADNHTRSGHFELVSEPQMTSKSYAGVFARHLHLEPAGPVCSGFGYSQFWPYFATLDIIPTSTFGGFGWIHSDVHVAIGGNLFPGYASLGRDGNCYEQRAGFLRTNDLRVDKGANLKFSLGEEPGFYQEDYACHANGVDAHYALGRNADFLDIDSLTVYGRVELDVTVRPEGLNLEPNESRCFPIIRYRKVQDGVLNHIVLKKDRLTGADHPGISGTYFMHLEFDTACHVVSLCVSTRDVPDIIRQVTVPETPGVTTTPPAGTYYIISRSDFDFKVAFGNAKPLTVRSGRRIDGVPEILQGRLNANGEYEYRIQRVTSQIDITIGPDLAGADTPAAGSAGVWSRGGKLHIRVDRR